MINPPIFPASSLKTSGFATSMLDPVLDLSVAPPAPTHAPTAIRA